MEDTKAIEMRTQDWKSQDITELIKSLSNFQADTLSVKEEKDNPFYGSTYADINDILVAIRPLMSKHKLAITQGNNFCSVTNGFYVTTTLMHTSGQWIRSEVRIPLGAKPNAQTVGGACTYGRRYGLSSILGISTEKDDDGNSLVERKKKNKQKVKPIKDGDDDIFG